MSDPKQERWLETAEQLKPNLLSRTVVPDRIVDVVRDDSAFQNRGVRDIAPYAALNDHPLRKGESIILAFPEHLVGYLTIRQQDPQAPVGLRVVVGEVPSELRDSYEDFPGMFPRGWQPDTEISVEGGAYRFERRHALQYVLIEVTSCREDAIRLSEVSLEAVDAVTTSAPPLPETASGFEQALDDVSLRTLRNCMHTVFEDGPKRDRRLWLGDLRLQAKLNYLTFRENDLVKRCLYLHAAGEREDGFMSACVFLNPTPHIGGEFIPDYALLFGPTLLDYVNATGDEETGRDLYPVARKQLDLIHSLVNAEGLFTDPGNLWLFIDWCAPLDRQAAEQATFIYSLKQIDALAARLGLEDDRPWLAGQAERMTAAALRDLLDNDRQVFVSGPERQISVASQVWMILAGVVSPEQGKTLLTKTIDIDGVVQPGCPYLYHHLLEAMFLCGMADDAWALIRRYWGGMLEKGASTFWEVFAPDDDFLSPYNSHLFNSYCHAWSCTPSLFLRSEI